MTGNTKQAGPTAGPFSCLLVFALVTAAAALVHQAGWSVGPVFIPALWGLGAVLPLRKGEGDLLAFGVTPATLGRSLRYFLLSSLAVFPLYAFGFWLWARLGLYLPAADPAGGIPFARWLLYNFLAVAFFEEAFFRGFVQGRFESWARVKLPNPRSVFWVPILVSASLFAVAHVAVFSDPLRAAVFLPALLFGWLRARTGGLLAPILSHGTANLVSLLLLRSLA